MSVDIFESGTLARLLVVYFDCKLNLIMIQTYENYFRFDCNISQKWVTQPTDIQPNGDTKVFLGAASGQYTFLNV